MFGWINDCTEKLVISKFGVDQWHEIKRLANCSVDDDGFLRHQYYPDASTVELVVAASEVLGLTVDQVLEAFGTYFMEFTRSNGYERLLACQGNTLRSWLSNMNALHDHLESSLPPGMVKPVFWCESDDHDDATSTGATATTSSTTSRDEAMILHYYSKRGNLLVPVVIGVVKEVSRYHFDVDIDMELLQKQDVDGATHTSWRIKAKDPKDSWKITIKESATSCSPATFDDACIEAPLQCPFTGVVYNRSTTCQQMELAHEKVKIPIQLCPQGGSSSSSSSCMVPTICEAQEDASEATDEPIQQCPHHCMGSNDSHALTTSQPSTDATRTNGMTHKKKRPEPNISGRQMKTIFPYHVVVDEDFDIIQVGASLPALMELRDEKELLGHNIQKIFCISRPIMGRWDWKEMRKLEDQTFFVDPVDSSLYHVKFKANLVRLVDDKGDNQQEFQVMIVMSPDVKNVQELRAMQLTMSDLPLHSFQRDAVFLGEHIVSEVKSAHKLEKLSKKLQHEKKLSTALLHALLPARVADILRDGKTVQPEMHEDATLFFSDIVGFTTICDSIFPWDVVDLLNRLYCVMDFLALKFDLYKIETIGDAYLCACGLPTADPLNAQKVANFAIAVLHCSQLVKNPVDGMPIQLRIGIHSGSVMTGVVGMTTPRFCVFGDTVNTASRHESTGLPGKIQCSSVTHDKLQFNSNTPTQEFLFSSRGLIDMKGKGLMATYFLDGGSESNHAVSPHALEQLSTEIEAILKTKTFSNKPYFKRYGRRGSETTFIDEFVG